MKTVLFFSNNQNKIKEVKKFFINKQIKILSLNDFPKINSPKETGKGFAENAKIKSRYGFHKFGIPCFGDDSGICIGALNNKPGIHSKKFLEKFPNKNQAFKYIIKKTKLLNNTSAYFETSICLTLKYSHHIIFRGKISGYIVKKQLGLNGFGYDPLFIPNGYEKTFAQMNLNQKNNISHRGLALAKLKSFLTN